VTAFIDAPQEGIQADALVTKTPGLAIGALAADCAPVLLADTENGIVGAAHSGWRGAFDGILASVAETMRAHGAAHITAAIGPSISKAAYEVGPEFIARFEADYAEDLDLFAPSQKHTYHMFDLPQFVQRQLGRVDVKAHILAACTYADETRFFSYRRATHRQEADYGRQISAICLPA
jgi:YfiH family protein